MHILYACEVIIFMLQVTEVTKGTRVVVQFNIFIRDSMIRSLIPDIQTRVMSFLPEDDDYMDGEERYDSDGATEAPSLNGAIPSVASSIFSTDKVEQKYTEFISHVISLKVIASLWGSTLSFSPLTINQ